MSSRYRRLQVETRGRIEVSRGRGIFHQRRKRTGKEKGRAAEAARPGIPGKETLRIERERAERRAVNPGSGRRRIRLALELAIQVRSRVADADERARSRVLHADPTHVV